MSPELARDAARLLAAQPGAAHTPEDVADRAVDACERLVRHLSRVIGDTAMTMLLERSIALASREVPWLRTSTASQLRAAMAQHDVASISAAFVAILVALVGLLERLIGEGLVARLLNEVWPTIFVVPAAKEPP